MKLLYINMVNLRQVSETGGSYGNKRISDMLKCIYGVENFFIYDMVYYRSFFHTFRNTLFGRAGGYKQDDLHRIISMIEKNSIDIVHITSNIGTLARDLKEKIETIKIITFCHNLEYKFLKQSLARYSVFKKLAYSINVLATFKSEKNACKHSDLLITINKRDSDDFYIHYARKADFCLPMSYEDKFESKRSCLTDVRTDFILFVGSNFFGNTEGLFWFIENCLTKINIKLIVVGSGMDAYRNKYPNYNVEFLGFVKDLSDYYYEAAAVVLPIISGSGMKTKTCEALMYGKTIFGTKEAFEGYELDYDKIGSLCNNEEDFINSINGLKSERVNNYSRQVFLNKYETNIVRKMLENKLKEKEML